MFNEYQLKIIVESMMMRHWGLKLTIPVKINKRMNGNVRGRFRYTYCKDNKTVLTPKLIEMSNTVLQNSSIESIIDTILHESTHYACCLLKKPLHDGDYYFENELIRVGATSTRTKVNAGEKHQVKCIECGKVCKESTTAGRTKRTIINKTSNCCHARLKYGGVRYVQDSYVASDKIKSECEIVKKLLELSIVSTNVRYLTVSLNTEFKPVQKNAMVANSGMSDIIEVGRRGVTNAQMIPAIEKAIQNNSKITLLQLKKEYPIVFENSKKYIKKSFISVFNKLME